MERKKLPISILRQCKKESSRNFFSGETQIIVYFPKGPGEDTLNNDLIPNSTCSKETKEGLNNQIPSC